MKENQGHSAVEIVLSRERQYRSPCRLPRRSGRRRITNVKKLVNGEMYRCGVEFVRGR